MHGCIFDGRMVDITHADIPVHNLFITHPNGQSVSIFLVALVFHREVFQVRADAVLASSWHCDAASDIWHRSCSAYFEGQCQRQRQQLSTTPVVFVNIKQIQKESNMFEKQQ